MKNPPTNERNEKTTPPRIDPSQKHGKLKLKTRPQHGEQGHKPHSHQNPDATSDSKNQ
jgi:hypothetical protein